MATITMYNDINVDDAFSPVFAAVATGGTGCQTGTDPTATWTLRTLPASSTWSSVCYGNSMVVAVAGTTVAASSPDGATWTARTLPVSGTWKSVCFGKDRFIAIADGTATVYSLNGVEWFQGGSLPASTTWSSIAYGIEQNNPSNNPSDNPSYFWETGIFVAICSGTSTSGAYSIDGGATWHTSILPSGDWRSVCYGNGMFVAVSYNSIDAAISYDGINWQRQDLPSISNWSSVCYGNGQFVAVAYNTSKAATSSNGILWDARTLSATANWNAVCYGVSSLQGFSIYMAVCYGATTGSYSYDGITWVARALANSANYTSICFAPITWASGDTLAITNNAIVTVNTHQTKFWKAVTGTYGKIRIENNSTDSAIGFYMGRSSAATANAITPTGLFGIEIEGDWILLGYGSGVASQSFTLPSQYTEYIPCIEVETGYLSETWEIWNNITGAIGPYMKILGQDGLDFAGNGKRGNYFVQSASANPIAILSLTSGVTTANSRWVTCASTSGVFPGAIITGDNIPANTVVQKVLSDGITLELNLVCTAAGSSKTFTCYNPLQAQYSNVITVGDGTNGNVVPNGARVRIANIIFSDRTAANLTSASSLVEGNITIALASPISAQICLFGRSYVSMAQAASVYFRHVGFSYKFALSECYAVDIDYMGTAATPTYWYLSTKWILRDQRYATLPPAGYTAPTGSCVTVISAITNAKIKHWHDVVYSSALFSGTGSTNQVDVQYSDDMIWDNIRLVQLNAMRAVSCLSASVRCFRNSFSNLEIYGCNPISVGTSDDNTFTNIEYSLSMNSVIRSFATLMRVWADPNGSILNGSPSDSNPSELWHEDWEELNSNTPYYIKTRTYYSWMDRSEKTYYDSNEYSCVPFQGGWQFPDFVSIKPSEVYAHSVVLDWIRRAPEPAVAYFEIYRGTSPGFTERSPSNKVYGNSANTATCTQGIKVSSISTAARIFTFDSAGKTITASGTPGSFLTDGFAVGDTVFVNGSYYGNDGTYTITALTATIMTVSEALVNEICSLAPAVSICKATSKSLSTRAFTVAAARTITIPAGQAWTTADGFAVGDVVDISGSRTKHNNGAFTINTLTTTVMTVNENTVDEVTPTSTSVVTTRIFTFATAGDTLTASGSSPGSWITDGHVVGDTVYCTSTTNPGPFTITDLTATVMTFSENVTDETCAAGTIVYRRMVISLRKPTAGTRYYYRLRKYNFNSISTLSCCAPGYFYTTTRATTGTNLATITTSVGHGFIVGQYVNVEGLVDPLTAGANLYIGLKQITTTASLTTFAYAITHGNESTADTLGKISPATLMSTYRECTDNIATITTNYPHLFVMNQSVNISLMTDSTYNGTFSILSVPSTTTFTYSLTHADEGSTADTAGVLANRTLFSCSNIVSRAVAAAPSAVSNDVVTMTFSVALKKITIVSTSWLTSGFLALDTITVSGSVSGNDGTYTISTVTASELVILESFASDEIGTLPAITVTGRPRATLTVPIAHGYVVGQTITVFGMNDATYNGTYTVRSLPSTTSVLFSITHDVESTTADNSGKITTPRWDFDNIYYLGGFKFENNTNYITNVVNSIYNSMFAPGIKITGQGIPSNTTVVSVDPSGREMIISNNTTTSTDAILATAINVARVRVDTNVVTIITSSPHNMTVGYKVYVSLMTDTTYNGTYTITQVPSTVRFSYALTHADAAEAPVTTGVVQAADITLNIPVQVGMAVTSTTNVKSGTEVVSVESPYMITLSQTPDIAIQYTNVTFQTFTESPELNCVPNLYKKAINFATYSRDFTNAAWVKSNITPTGNTYQAPTDNSWAATAGLDQLAATGAGGTATLTVSNLKPSTQYTASFWVRADQTAAIPNGVDGSFAFGTTTTNFTAVNDLKQYAAVYTTGGAETSKTIVITITTNGQVIHCGDVMVNMGATPTAHINTAAATAVELYPCATPLTKIASYGRSYYSSATNKNQGVQLTIGTAPTGSYFSEIHVSSEAGFTPSASTLFARTFSISTYHLQLSGSSRNTFTNITKLPGGGAVGNPVYLAVSSIGNNFINADIDLEYTNTLATGAISILTGSHNNLFHNFYFGKIRNYEVGTSIIYTQWSNAMTSNKAQNLRCDNYDIAMSQQSLNASIKGVAGCRAIPAATATAYTLGGTSDGMAAAYGSTYGSMFYESYISETEGFLALIPEDTLGDTKPYSVLAGTTHSFNNQGVLYIPNDGSIFEFTWPNKIYGVSGFTKRKPKLLGYDLGGTPATAFDLQESLKIEVAINTGNGYENLIDPSGDPEYFRATSFNLSAVDVSATDGFYMKIKITSRKFMRHGAQTNLFVTGETVRGALSGATALVDEVYDYGTTGCIVISNVTGTFIPAENIVNNTTSQLRAPNVATNGFAVGPSFTSYFNGLQIFTDVDQTVLYPSTTSEVELTGLITGSEVRAYVGTDPATAEEIAGIESSTNVFSFLQSVSGQAGYIVIHALNYQSWRLNYTYGSEDVSIPVQQIVDRQYYNRN